MQKIYTLYHLILVIHEISSSSSIATIKLVTVKNKLKSLNLIKLAKVI